jgi:hypothetical protein
MGLIHDKEREQRALSNREPSQLGKPRASTKCLRCGEVKVPRWL